MIADVCPTPVGSGRLARKSRHSNERGRVRDSVHWHELAFRVDHSWSRSRRNQQRSFTVWIRVHLSCCTGMDVRHP